MRKYFGFKVLLTLFCVLSVVFPDITLTLINAIIKLKMNVLGFFLEPLLQWVFDMPLRQAQMVSAWIYLLIATFLGWLLCLKLSRALSTLFRVARLSWLAKNQWQKLKVIVLGIVIMSASAKVVLIFM